MKMLALIFCAFFASLLSAQEILQNGSFDLGIGKECFVSQPSGHFEVSEFVENLTWNKCLRLQLAELKDNKVGAVILFGNLEKHVGFAAEPETTYEFSFEVKGSVPGIVVCGFLFHNEEPWWKANARVKSSVDGTKITPEWTSYKGVFRTGKDTVRAALGIQLWANETLVERNNWRPGQELLVDNVSIRKRRPLLDQVAADTEKISSVPVLFASSSDNRFGDDIAFAIKTDEKKIVVSTTLPDSEPKKKVAMNGSGIWADDVVEVFFGPASNDRVLSQFVLASGGGRYMGNGQRELQQYNAWQGKVSGRSFTFEIPWELIGFIPEAGKAIPFNIGAQFAGKAHFLPPLKKNFHDVSNYNLLIFGTLAEYLQREFPGAEQYANLPAGEAVARMRLMKRNAEVANLGDCPFIAARFPVTHGFSLPLEITRQEVIDSPIELTALINEHKVLPFAILNRTGRTETYRIVVRNTNLKDEIDINGLDGGFSNITLREALAVKDSDAPEAGLIFDPLPLMNDAQSITVAAGETGLVWISFDCDRPGSFKGLIRVIPLSGPAEVKRYNYQGPMRDYPLTLNILPYSLNPIRGHGIWGPSYLSESLFKVHQALAPGELMLNPWMFKFRFDDQGKVINELPELRDKLREWYGLFAKHGFNPKLKMVIGYSVYTTMVRAFLPDSIKPDSPECFAAFENYLCACAKLMKDAGIPEHEYAFEVFDEPHGKNYERDLMVLRSARKALPGANLIMTWAPQNFGYTPEMIRSFIPLVNYHLFHHLLLQNPAYMEVAEEVKRTPGKHYGYYVCSTSMRESLHRYYRLVGWKGIRTQAEFYHIYTFCESPWGTPGATNWKAAANGGLVLRSGLTAIPTIRYEAAREGLTDVRYLELLDDPEFTRHAAEKVVVDSPHDPRLPDRLRSEIIKRLKAQENP